MASRRLDGQRAFAHIDDAGPEQVCYLDNFTALLGWRVHLEQHEFALDGRLVSEVGDFVHDDKLVQLLGDLLP